MTGRCDALINISASPYDISKFGRRHSVTKQVSERLGVPVVYVNQVGAHDELLFDGDSHVVAPNGKMLAQAKRWQEDLLIVDMAVGTQRMHTVQLAMPPSAIQDIHQALVCGIKGYCDKTGQKSVVLGLSGGIDSAVVAALAVEALGQEKVVGLLMPGPYSSEGSLTDARELAKNLGIRSFECPIGPANSAVLSSLSDAFQQADENVAEENIQSRLRGTLVMAYANKFNAMALTTGNKSEIAVGYCTIYGDMNGGLAPIGDLYKHQVYELAAEINREQILIPSATIEKPPSAELRPDQKDSDSLPPYDQLDEILHGFLERSEGADELVRQGHDAELVQRILRLVEVNEYKRRQSAPILRISGKAFGVGRRMPIARAIS